MKSRLAAVGLLALAGAAIGGTPLSAGAERRLHGGAFFSNCLFSHTSNDDPIVYPGRPGLSHAHTFFGNVSTDSHSTRASLLVAGTSCRLRADTAAYWIPTLYQAGREVRPRKAQFYYVMRGYDEMRPFPAGLRVIAGDAHAARPQSATVAYWTCGAGGGLRSAPTRDVPTCRPMRTRYGGTVQWRQTFLELHVNFPDCWDGRRLDSRDHMSHMAHRRNYLCPASHPVKVPLIRLGVQYPSIGGRDVRLASGGRFSAHADFINAWDQRVLTRLVRECFRDRCNDAVSALRRNR